MASTENTIPQHKTQSETKEATSSTKSETKIPRKTLIDKQTSVSGRCSDGSTFGASYDPNIKFTLESFIQDDDGVVRLELDSSIRNPYEDDWVLRSASIESMTDTLTKIYVEKDFIAAVMHLKAYRIGMRLRMMTNKNPIKKNKVWRLIQHEYNTGLSESVLRPRLLSYLDRLQLLIPFWSKEKEARLYPLFLQNLKVACKEEESRIHSALSNLSNEITDLSFFSRIFTLAVFPLDMVIHILQNRHLFYAPFGLSTN